MRGATGNRSQFMIGIEPSLTQRPDLGDMLSLVHKPPLGTELEPSEVEAGFVDPSGFATETDPGFITGDNFETTLKLSPASLFEFFYQLAGQVIKTSIANSTWRYVFTPDPDGVEFALAVFTGLPPVERRWTLGAIIHTLTFPLGGDPPREVNLKGAFIHDTSLSTRQSVAVAGSYAGPDVRGHLARNDLGDLFAVYDATTDSYRLQQAATYVPEVFDLFETFTGFDADQTVAVDHNGQGAFANAQGFRRIRGTPSLVFGTTITFEQDARFLEDIDTSNGKRPYIIYSFSADNLTIARVIQVINENSVEVFGMISNPFPGLGTIEPMIGPVDLGFFENGTPLEIIFPGSSADRSTATDGDTWVFRAPGNWTSPTPIFRTGGVKFHIGHQEVRSRRAGTADAWTNWVNTDGSVEISWPASLETGDGSLHRTNWDRDGAATVNINLQQKLRQKQLEWVQLVRSGVALEMEIAWTAGMVGDAGHQHAIVIRAPWVRASKAPRPISGTDAIQIAPELQGRTNDAGVAPWEIELVTDIDWTVPVIP